MELTAVARSLLRRWYVVLIGVLATAGLVYAAHDRVPPTYDAAATVLLLPPEASLEGGNPLLALGGLEQPADLVVAYLAGEVPRSEFGQRHPTSEYEIVVDPLSRGPLIMVTVHDPSSAEAILALQTMLDAVPAALDTLQDDVDAPERSRLTSMPLIVDSEPTEVNKDTLRAMIAALAVGLVLTLVSAVAVDSLIDRRRARRDETPSGNSPDQPGPNSRRAERAQPDRTRSAGRRQRASERSHDVQSQRANSTDHDSGESEDRTPSESHEPDPGPSADPLVALVRER